MALLFRLVEIISRHHCQTGLGEGLSIPRDEVLPELLWIVDALQHGGAGSRTQPM